MNVLVTGARGMLGGDVCRELAAQGEHIVATDSTTLDVRVPEQVRRAFEAAAPDLVVHLAALTDVDYCEREPREAFRTNAIGTQNVALACQAAGVPMVYASTISVFDGAKPQAYTEFDTPNPQSAYSRAKYEGEKLVQQLVPHAYVVRAGWMFGGGSEDKKFVAKIVELARTRRTLKVVDDKFGSPTYTLDFARALIALSRTGWYGVYHAVNLGEPCSRYAFAEAILEMAGITTCELVPVSSAEFPLPAPRPRMEAGINLRAELLGMPPMRPWRAALREYVQGTLVVRGRGTNGR